jgi:probable F420-dependent oxidoreductase
VKVRIGVGTGPLTAASVDVGDLVEQLEQRGFDSLWLSDVLTAPVDDPLTALAYAAGRVRRLKLGTTLVLPGRNPVRLAKELATLDRVSSGRLLVTLVVGLRRRAELAAMGVDGSARGDLLDEALPLLRRLWSEDDVEHHGTTWSFEKLTVEPKPLQQPLEVWLGGSVASALRRTGLLADGWLPSLCTPVEAAEGRTVIEEVAAGAGRAIDAEHFGVSIGYLPESYDEHVLGNLAARLATRPSTADVADVVPAGPVALRRLLERFLDVGFSKFVVRPIVTPVSWVAELDELGSAVLDLQS